MTNRYQPPDDLAEFGITFREEDAKYHGKDVFFRASVYPGRRVAIIPGVTWPADRPEDCEDDTFQGQWYFDKILVCKGCGLDCT